MENIGYYDPVDYWEPIFASANKHLILNPGDFYILASKEAVNVPPQYAAEMVAYDTLIGEFRVHYAGFFDPGLVTPRAAGRVACGPRGQIARSTIPRGRGSGCGLVAL